MITDVMLVIREEECTCIFPLAVVRLHGSRLQSTSYNILVCFLFLVFPFCDREMQVGEGVQRSGRVGGGDSSDDDD